MAELRFILFIAGLVFLVALAAWELRRPRQAASGNAALRRPVRSEPELGTYSEPAADVASVPLRTRNPIAPPRLEVVELDEFPIDVEPDVPRPAATATAATLGDRVAAARAEPLVRSQQDEEAAGSVPATLRDRIPDGISVLTESARGEEAAGLAVAASGSQIVVPPAAESVRSIFVDWPSEERRHIVSLRLVPGSNERLSGRTVRLAMTACGFVHGPFGIFHLPDESGRAVISVASLSKPGVLDPVAMDFQRLPGLSLFTVLPGTLPPATALDHLLEAARELSQRLGTRLQDDQGRPLDAERLEDLRDRMQSLSASGYQAEPAA